MIETINAIIIIIGVILLIAVVIGQHDSGRKL